MQHMKIVVLLKVDMPLVQAMLITILCTPANSYDKANF